jgi:Rrf2 family iron-sulfur cluster assembly transcriptional regulator
MKITAQIHYAIVIMTDLAIQGEGLTVTGDDIARRQNISFAFVAQLLNKLKHAGLLESVRGGITGGYQFKGSPLDVSVKRIIDAIDPLFCICPSEETKTGQSVDDVVRSIWKRISAEAKKSLAMITIGDLCRQIKELESGVGSTKS